MLSTFRVGRRFNGGELRSYHLARAMAARFDVEIISLGGRGTPASRAEIAPGVVETVIPRSLAQHAVELSYQRDLGLEVPVGDTLMPELLRFTPAYLDHAAGAVRGAALVQLEHPFMYPAVADLGGRPPLVYNAHNAEFQMKRDMLPATAVGDSLLERVSEVEGAAVAAAALIATCSREDADNLRAAFGAGSARWVDVPNGVSLDAVPFTGAADRHARGADWLRRLQLGGGRITGVRRAAVFIANGQPSSWEAAEAIIAAAPGMPTTCFLLVGTHAVRFHDRVLPPNVVALGPVADYARRLLLACADAGLNPMTSGSGSNLKVPEYLAAGLPVMATPYGVRGFDVEDGVHVRLTPVEDLAASLSAAYEDETETQAIALRGRELVEERYRWEDIGARLTGALAEVAGC
jgi:glycosyltransferase involved in cell wall biosynthesis